MSAELIFEQFFKSETKNSGNAFLTKNAVILNFKSDTQINGYIKGSTSARVSFASNSISDNSFTASCSCPVSKKGQFCKHIWATLLFTEKVYPDFLTSKNSMQASSSLSSSKQDAFKEKQSDYKKLQYQKQKLRLKQMKLEKEKQASDSSSQFPVAIEQALVYFSENGFPLEQPITEESLNNARKRLARVFHPDVGGSHDEAVDLNKYYDTLARFFQF